MDDRSIAYFSMEIAVQEGMPTYSGGLGVLAGDTLRSAADLSVPIVGATLLSRKGYFYQKIDPIGWQKEEPAKWVVEDFLQEMQPRVSVSIEGRDVQIRAWQYEITGISGYTVPIYFLDSDLDENSAWDRTLTDYLYGGDQHYRICQEVILGIGGVRMLRALGYNRLERFHMNEGHAAFLTLELLEEEARKAGETSISRNDIAAVRSMCVFTTHTPVAAGHDQFPIDLFARVFQGRDDFLAMKDVFSIDLDKQVFEEHKDLADVKLTLVGGNYINMTYLALNLSHFINGVAKRHTEITRAMFGGYAINAITNGVHVPSWVSEPFQKLYDRYIPTWQQDNFTLRYALSIPAAEIWQAHLQAKKELIAYANRETNAGMDNDVLTICFARRMTAYKRADLIFTDIERLKHIAANAGRFQIIFAGKAHPQDQAGKEIIKRILDIAEALRKDIRLSYFINYDIKLAQLLVGGADLWLNTPEPPMEASGTSGMKAALNGVPSLSILDGWWIEGHLEGVTGWAIGEYREKEKADRAKDAASLYDKLEHAIIPMYYQSRVKFINIMRHAIALNGSFFNTQRMLQQYVLNAYFL